MHKVQCATYGKGCHPPPLPRAGVPAGNAWPREKGTVHCTLYTVRCTIYIDISIIQP